jgi:hypothetical protein
MAYMKVNKAIALFIALAFIALYATSNLGVPMKHIEEARARMAPAWWPERVRYGDLYSFSNLAEFKSEVGVDRNALHPNPLSTLPRDINLYAICDSYLTENFVKSNLFFSRVDRYWQVNLYLDKPVETTLDPHKTNVLLIEKTEREVKEMLTTNKLDMLLEKIRVAKANSSGLAPQPVGAGRQAASKWKKLEEALFNPHCNDNLQELLFDYQVLTPLRELKAGLNRSLFGRISPDVVISPDSNHLLYELTVNPRDTGFSSFAPLEKATVDTLVDRLNKVYSTYLARGFDYVFLSIIPNSATILERNNPRYNQLIPLLYAHPGLKIPVVSVYKSFMDTPLDIIAKGDTHWNSAGFYLWLSEFNARLETLPAKRPN